MTPLYCSKGHENTVGNRFCSQCGELLATPRPPAQGQAGAGASVSPGTLLGERYRIVRQLGQGGFGRTYLAEDTHRFNERCVLKEFAPQVANPNALQKAQELFEREAGVLYKLQHPQIPKFREMYRCNVAGAETLLLVQDYVEGQTYRDLLHSRTSKGDRFTEAEVTQLLIKLLPVLEYIHSQGVIHRDVSPENLIWRTSDNQPVLIDFGGVKQMAASAISQFTNHLALQTHIGKPGYAPEEQIRLGKAYPCSDLYSLAVTALVLLIGKEPQEFYDSSKAIWLWRRQVSINPNLAAVLEKMLAHRISDRYQNAREVLQALQSTLVPHQPSNLSQIRTVVVAPAAQPAPTPPQPAPIPQPAPSQPIFNPFGILLFPFRIFGHFLRAIAIFATTLAILAGVGVWLTPKLISLIPPLPTLPGIFIDESQPDQIVARREALQLSEAFFERLVDELFLSQHPDLQGKDLTKLLEDANFQQEWNQIANEVLRKLEGAALSEEARSKIGQYTVQDYQNWNRRVNALVLNREADERFYELFPEVRGQQLNPETLGQIWYAIAADRLDESSPQ